MAQDLLESLSKENEGFSYYAPRSQPSVESALAAMRNCDAALFILGHNYGAMAPGFQISHAEREYQEAKLRGLPVLAFLRQADYGLLPGQFEKEPARIAKVKAFRAQLQSGAFQLFTDAPSLAVVLRKTLETEFAGNGVAKKYARASSRATASAAFAKTPDKPTEAVTMKAGESSTQTLPILQKALSMPFERSAMVSKSLLWWGLGAVACIAALVAGYYLRR